MASTLSIGILRQDTIYDDLTVEILDHQGICYESIEDGHSSSEAYPVVLVPSFTDSSMAIAKRRCLRPENVLVAESEIDLKRIGSLMSGQETVRGDQLDLYVNEEELKLVGAIKDRMSNLGLPLVTKWYWPDGASACCVVTHDIDWLTYSPLHRAVYKGPPGRLGTVRMALGAILTKKNFGWNIPEMLLLEKQSAVKSTFFFQTDYGKDNTTLERSIALVREQGCEMGLHGARSSHKSMTALKGELEAFERTTGVLPRGVRYHILKLLVPETWQLEVTAGLKYDATFSHNEYFGLRAEVCFPYHPFGARRLQILELPTCFMDWTALARQRRGSGFTETLKSLVKTIKRYHGVVVVNFHNTYLNRHTFPDVVEGYEWLLREVSAGDFWVATASECQEWWTRRTNCKPTLIIEPGNGIRGSSLVPLVVQNEGSAFTLNLSNQ